MVMFSVANWAAAEYSLQNPYIYCGDQKTDCRMETQVCFFHLDDLLTQQGSRSRIDSNAVADQVYSFQFGLAAVPEAGLKS